MRILGNQKYLGEKIFLNIALAGVAQWTEWWPVNQRSPVRFLVRAHAWVVGQVPDQGVCERQRIDIPQSH